MFRRFAETWFLNFQANLIGSASSRTDSVTLRTEEEHVSPKCRNVTYSDVSDKRAAAFYSG